MLFQDKVSRLNTIRSLDTGTEILMDTYYRTLDNNGDLL